MSEIKIGYKGFSKDLKCNNHQFVIGETYTKENWPEGKIPRTCSSDGFHYCNKIEQVYQFFGLNGNNRFCEVQILGPFKDDSDKSCTTSIKILREITSEVYEKKIEESMNLSNVKELQTQYPLIHVGGSIGLFLHGIRLKRWVKSNSDIDIVSPYFILFDSFGENEVKYIDGKKSGNDFDETFIFNETKVDCRIDPKQRYVNIEYNGFKYKVSTFETIMEAKVKYSANGQAKHRDDIREMCKVNVPK